MRLSNIAHLYRLRLRRRRVQELLALVGIAVGVALVFASLVAGASLTGSVQQLTDGVVGDSRLQLAGRGPAGLDAALLPAVRALPGVRDAAPILETRAVVSGPSGRRPVVLVGGDPRFARLGGPLLRLFTSDQLARQQAIGLPAPVARAIGVTFGQPLTVTTGAGVMRASLGGQLQAGDIGGLVHSPVAIAPLPYAQVLSGMPGRVTRIFVQPRPGRDEEVRAALRRLAAGRLNVLDARSDVKVFEQAALPTNQSTALFSVFAALVGFLFALSAVLLTVPQRRRFITDLRIAGHAPRVVVQVMVFDALVLGIAGTAVGLLAGDQLSRRMFASVPGYLGFAFPIGSQRIVDWSSLSIAAAAGLLAAVVAVLAPVREIFSRRPAAQPPRAGERPRWQRALPLAGLAALAIAAVVPLLAPAAAIAGMVLLAAALLLLLGPVLTAAVEALAWLGRFVRSAVPALAAMELRSRASRTRMFALAATGAIAVFASVAIGGAHRDLLRGLDASAAQIDGNAEVWATFPGEPNAFATTPFHVDRRVLERVERLPGVERVTPYCGGFLDVGLRRLWVLAPPPDAERPIPPSQLAGGDLAVATARLRAGGWIALSEAVAHELGVDVGDALTLPTPVPTRLRVAALTTNLGWPPGAMIVNAGDFARAWGSQAPSALHVRTTGGVAPEVVRREVVRALGPGAPLEVETVAERRARHFAAARGGLERLTQISVLVLGAAILAMATAMGGMIWQRRPAIAGLKVDGFSERELWRALLLESGLLLGTGCAVGAAFGLGGQVLLSRALGAVTGFPVFYTPGLLVALAILAIVLAVALSMLALPGLLAVRVQPSPRAAQ
jgi:putative ABC transport system permease protein